MNSLLLKLLRPAFDVLARDRELRINARLPSDAARQIARDIRRAMHRRNP